jgi:hypothetical protein
LQRTQKDACASHLQFGKVFCFLVLEANMPSETEEPSTKKSLYPEKVQTKKQKIVFNLFCVLVVIGGLAVTAVVIGVWSIILNVIGGIFAGLTGQ